jgi:hypothetical protein
VYIAAPVGYFLHNALVSQLPHNPSLITFIIISSRPVLAIRRHAEYRA